MEVKYSMKSIAGAKFADLPEKFRAGLKFGRFYVQDMSCILAACALAQQMQGTMIGGTLCTTHLCILVREKDSSNMLTHLLCFH